MLLESATWPEIEAQGGTALVVVPLGSTEQHGPHLPLDTDTRIATELAERLCRVRSDVVQAPALPYGASGEHSAFPGTLLINHDVLASVVIELVRSARGAFGGVIVISGHGGNGPGLAVAAERCAADGDPLLIWKPSVASGDAHAGRTETSLMLAIDPATVHIERAQAGRTEALRELMAQLRTHGVRPVSSNGVLGDPNGASAAEGRGLLESMTADLAACVAERWPSGELTT